MSFGRIITASLVAGLAPLLGLSALAAALGMPVPATQTFTLVDLLRTAAQLESGKPTPREIKADAGKQKRNRLARLRTSLSKASGSGFVQTSDHAAGPVIPVTGDPRYATLWTAAYPERSLFPAPVAHLAPLRC